MTTAAVIGFAVGATMGTLVTATAVYARKSGRNAAVVAALSGLLLALAAVAELAMNLLSGPH